MKRLASWTPRSPSPELEVRLFGRRLADPAAAAAIASSSLARWLGWGVPSLGTALVVVSLWVHPVVQPGLVLGATNSAQLAALSSAAAQSAQNSLPLRAFAWTNAAQPRATNGSYGILN